MKHLLITKIAQQQNISPKLYQSLKILQMNSLELDNYIADAVLENPVLDQEYESDIIETQSLDVLKESIMWKWEDRDNWNDGNDYIEEIPVYDAEDSLRTHLASQFNRYFTNQELILLDCIIDFLDDKGFISASNQEISESCGFDEELVSYGITYLQTLKPIGVCARNLTECLCIQLSALGYKESIYMLAVEHHLKDIAAGKYSKIAKSLNCTKFQAEEICKIIKLLHPKPGACFDGPLSRSIIPDIVVIVQNNEITAKVSQWGGSRIYINSYYENMLSENKYSDASEYLKEKIAKAKITIKAINDRKNTLQSIVHIIIDYQRLFFMNISSDIKPMKICELAKQIELHESTVSRAISGKYLLCKQGTFPLKFFFSSKSFSIDGLDAVNRNTIKSHVKNIIDNEDKEKPLSDSQIVEILAKEGIILSRRVISKYRSELCIFSQSARKRKDV